MFNTDPNKEKGFVPAKLVGYKKVETVFVSEKMTDFIGGVYYKTWFTVKAGENKGSLFLAGWYNETSIFIQGE